MGDAKEIVARQVWIPILRTELKWPVQHFVSFKQKLMDDMS